MSTRNGVNDDDDKKSQLLNGCVNLVVLVLTDLILVLVTLGTIGQFLTFLISLSLGFSWS